MEELILATGPVSGVGQLVLIDFSLVRNEIHRFGWNQTPRLFPAEDTVKFVADVEDDEDGNDHICEKEVADRPSASGEDWESVGLRIVSGELVR